MSEYVWVINKDGCSTPCACCASSENAYEYIKHRIVLRFGQFNGLTAIMNTYLSELDDAYNANRDNFHAYGYIVTKNTVL